MIWLKRIGLILLIICLGTVIDYVVHQMDPRFSVPFVYFPHKIFYGTLWAFVGYALLKKHLSNYLSQAVVISATPAVILQVMYFIQHHLLVWVAFLFLFLHFLMFIVPASLICKRFQRVFQ